MSVWQTCLVRMFVTPSVGSVELGRTACQLILQKEVPQRDSFQLGTQVWKLVCSSLLREELLRSWIGLGDTCLSQNLCPVSNDVLSKFWPWERSSILTQEVPSVPLYSTWRHLPGLHYSTCFSQAFDKRLWWRCSKLILQAIWNCEGLGVNSTLGREMLLDLRFS